MITDELAAQDFFRQKLCVEKGYALFCESSSLSGLKTLRENNYDILMIKFGMADLDTSEFIKELKRIDQDSTVIVLIKEVNSLILEQVNKLGVYDYISISPVNMEKLGFLLKKGIELRLLTAAHRKFSQGLKEHNVALQKQNTLLAKRIEESTKNLNRLYGDLRSTYLRTIKVLAQTIDAKDHYTHSHSENVANIAVTIAEEMGLSVKDIEMIRQACELHDLGKIGIQDNILGKPSELTPQEWEQIKRHPLIGAEILEPLTFLDDVTELIRQHHEHFDGSGYPEGRKGDDILLGARIIHLADAYESMRSSRSYRENAFSREEAVAEIKKHTGSQFDPKVTHAFLRVVSKL